MMSPMAIFRFPIPDDDEMLAAAAPLEAFLKERGLVFSFPGRGVSVGRGLRGENECMFEVEVAAADAGDEALCVWRACVNLLGFHWPDSG